MVEAGNPANNAEKIKATKPNREFFIGPNRLKIISLVALTFQTTTLVLIMRYTRLYPSSDGFLYLTSTAVFLSECVKVVACLIAVFIQNKYSLKDTTSELNSLILTQPKELLKLVIPSGLYTLQNNLLYVALSNLDAVTYQITYQLKILTTALFMVFMLGKHITRLQWFSLFVLIIGVVFVQLTSTFNVQPAASTVATPRTQSRMVGLIAVLCATLSSGFAGVYFEKLMKHTAPSLWIRNIQMGFWGSILALSGVLFVDGAKVAHAGFFQGYTFKVLLVIGLQSFGGLCIAVVIKYADNLLKVFATSISIILSSVASYYLEDIQLSLNFVVGTISVISATVLYSEEEAHSAQQQKSLLPVSTKDCQ